MNRATNDKPHVVVLGAGFGGLWFCRSLEADARITLIDKHNHHTFQPLLYQVATAGLSAPDVTEPVRSIFRKDPRVISLMDTAQAIDLPERKVRLCHNVIDYDYLVIGLGGSAMYFGNDDWAEHAPPLKNIRDAMAMRWKLLNCFELAESTTDPALRKTLMTVVVVGGGPTGVELAGAVAELTRVVFKRDFRHIDTTQAQIILVEGGSRLLDQFDADLAAKARRQLEDLGVDVRFGKRISDIAADHVKLEDGTRIDTRCVLWGAGVAANRITQTLGIELGPGGRIPVEPDLSVPGHPEALAIGDIVTLRDANGVRVPGLAPSAIQMGKHAAKVIDRRITDARSGHDEPDPAALPFAYRDKGQMATVGRKRAIAEVGRFRFAGVLAWLAWLIVHLFFLIGFRNRVSVLTSWVYAYVTFRRGARIIFDEGCGPQKYDQDAEKASGPAAEPAPEDQPVTPSADIA
jgi:NADH dehydrogenase